MHTCIHTLIASHVSMLLVQVETETSCPDKFWRAQSTSTLTLLTHGNIPNQALNQDLELAYFALIMCWSDERDFDAAASGAQCF